MGGGPVPPAGGRAKSTSRPPARNIPALSAGVAASAAAALSGAESAGPEAGGRLEPAKADNTLVEWPRLSLLEKTFLLDRPRPVFFWKKKMGGGPVSPAGGRAKSPSRPPARNIPALPASISAPAAAALSGAESAGPGAGGRLVSAKAAASPVEWSRLSPFANSALYFGTGRGPGGELPRRGKRSPSGGFSFRQDEKKMGGGKRSFARAGARNLS